MRISAIPLLGALLLAACSDSPQPAAPAPATFDLLSAQATTFSGDATVLQANVLGVTTTLVKAGPLPSSGGADEASLLEAEVPGLLTAQVLHASTVGQGSHSRSEASVANVALTVAGASISAAFLMSRAEARCEGGTATTTGSSEIAELNINGQPIAVSGQPNQTITLPNGRVIINEQTSAGPGDITVNALHVIVDGVADVVVASAHADISCAAPGGAAQCKDFVTGGGWVTGTPSGAKGNFAVAGGIKNGAFWGHLNFIDHGPAGPKVKGTGVTAYTFVDPTTRQIDGTAEVNGQGGFTYTVIVSDNDEPGRNDMFDLIVSPSGYTASGTLGGGNIQLHKPCDGGTPF